MSRGPVSSGPTSPPSDLSRARAEREEGAEPPGPGEPWTVLRLIRWSARYLEEKGVREGRLDAEHLLADALETNRLDLYLQFDRPLSDEELARFKPTLLRRANREPLQHILGRVAFRELDLAVDARALIPRPETEVLVQEVLDWIREEGHGFGGGNGGSGAGAGDDGATGGLSALDVGTGTGAIALSLAVEGPFDRVVATDPSDEALELAAGNLAALEGDVAVEFRRGSLLEPVADGERFHVLVSNPPYIAVGEAESLDPEVREWEPREALFAGEDGLEVIRGLLEGASRVIHPGGLLAFEVGEGQASAVAALVRDAGGFDDVRIARDLAGRDRIVLGRRTRNP